MTDSSGYGAPGANVWQPKGNYVPPAPPPPPPAPEKRRLPVRFLVIALVLAVAGVATVAVVAMKALADEPGPSYPQAWDKRVEPFVAVVQRERGLMFEHPVHVDFLSVEAFQKKVTTDEDELTDEDRQELDQSTGLLRALGLLKGDVDLFDSSNALSGAGTLGYYSYDDERIRIRGTELTPAVRSTLVHELTHALQDQHFDLGKRFGQLEDSGDDAAVSGFQSIVEGDARRVEGLWRDGLSKAWKKKLARSEAAQAKQYDKDAKNVPAILETLIAAPYALGEATLRLAEEEGGRPAVDALFSSPPRTEEHSLDPWTLIADHQGFTTVDEPELADGEEKFDDGPFGALSWLLVLAERIPVRDALDAADGWGGDAYVAYDKGDTTCVKIAFRGDTPADLTQMTRAAQAWVARGPRGAASAKKGKTTVELRSCDPGKKADTGTTGDSQAALSMALTRTHLAATLLRSGADDQLARCAANRLVHTLSIKELNDPKIDPARVQRLVAPCRT